MVTGKQAFTILLAIVVLVAVVGMIIKMTASKTGGFYYAGNSIQYENPKEACKSIMCANGPANVIESTGDLFPYGSYRMVVRCYCPENPGAVITVPMVRALPLERY
ncbi:MAG: hypothetical protein QW666_00435 [Candidatus Woesearchaeota archaeon]